MTLVAVDSTLARYYSMNNEPVSVSADVDTRCKVEGAKKEEQGDEGSQVGSSETFE